METPLQAKDW